MPNRFCFFFPGQYTALQFEIVEPYFSYAASARRTTASGVIALRDAGDTSHIYHPAGFDTAACGFAITDEEQITEHFDFATR